MEHYDPDKIFAGTPQLWALRMIIVKALVSRWKTIHLDFKRAFSHAPIDRPVYVTLPRGYHLYDEDGKELCIRLRKSSEGLKQSAAQWEEVLNEFLLADGLTQCAKEPHMWRSEKLSGGTRAYITVYVDDMYMTTDDSEWLAGFRKRMDKLAPHKSLGEIQYALGCEITWSPDRKSVSITCARKITELLRKTGMESCKGAHTPLLPGSKLTADLLSPVVTDRSIMNEFRSAVGSLLYIMRGGRPDIAYACWYLACGMTAPTESLVLQLNHTLRYLQYSFERFETSIRESFSDYIHRPKYELTIDSVRSLPSGKLKECTGSRSLTFRLSTTSRTSSLAFLTRTLSLTVARRAR